MIEIMIGFWVLIFAIFFIGSIIGNSKYLAMIAGLWLVIFSILIIVTGVQVQSGTTTLDGNVTNNYQDMVVPYTDYATIWGVFLLLAALYIFLNALLYQK
jgi:hypothetical protein